MIRLCAFADEASSMLDEQISVLKKNQISLIELRNINGKNIKDISIEEALLYAEIFKENQISVWSIGSPLGKENIKTLDFNEYKKTVLHIFKLAKIFKTNNIRIFSFYEAFDSTELVYSYLNEMTRLANQYDLTLHHENEKHIFGETIMNVLKLMENVPDLNFILDPANYIQAGQDMTQVIENFFEKTSYFHIKDAQYESGAIVPAGFGDGKIEWILQNLKKDAVLTLEPHLHIFDGYKQIDQTELINQFTYSSNIEAFDAGCHALKNLLAKNNYKFKDGAYVKL